MCIEREEKSDDDDKEGSNEEDKNKTINALSNLFSTSISLSNCFETATKYECVTK